MVTIPEDREITRGFASSHTAPGSLFSKGTEKPSIPSLRIINKQSEVQKRLHSLSGRAAFPGPSPGGCE